MLNVEDRQYRLKGKHSTAELQQVLQKYLELYVMCPRCLLPETYYKIKGKSKISQYCQACGHKSPCDMEHKLSSFIMKQYLQLKDEEKRKVKKR